MATETTKQETKSDRLKSAGWKTGTAGEFLGLTPEENTFLDIKASLAVCLAKERRKSKISQIELAKRIGSSQSRITKAENMHPSIGVAFLIKALLGSGVTQRRIGVVIATGNPDAEAEGGLEIKFEDGSTYKYKILGTKPPATVDGPVRFYVRGKAGVKVKRKSRSASLAKDR